MKNPSLRRWTGALLIVAPVAFAICFTLPQMQFDYPAILRRPTAEVLGAFQAGGSLLVAIWYLLTFAAVLFVPIAVLLHLVLGEQIGEEARPALLVGSTFGVLAGLVQALGFIRWPVVVPGLAAAFLSPASNEVQRQAAGLAFEAIHLYAGAGVGESLGYLFTGTWTFFVALALLRSTLVRPWVGSVGMVLAAGIAIGTVEIAGWEPAGTVNAISYLAWAAWLVVLGVTILVRRAGRSVRT